MTPVEGKEGLNLLRKPFPPEQISKLPKGTKAQNECQASEKKNCTICGGWHHPKITHLDYVGHAALTDRLLDCDPEWNWEPTAWDENGSPKLDKEGGMWIKLTVCGVTRYGYGDAQGKTGNNAMKERIGDALRNAAMRFGAALDLWSKADLNKAEMPEPEPKQRPDEKIDSGKGSISPWTKKDLAGLIIGMTSVSALDNFMAKESAQIAIDLSEEDNNGIQSLFNGKRINLAKKEAEGGATV